MGISNNAILAFGFSLEENKPTCLEKRDCNSDSYDEDEGDSFESFDEMIVNRKLTPPPGEYQYESQTKSSLWIEYHKKANELEKACPVTLEWFCSYDYPMFFIALKGTVSTAHRGYVKNVELKTISQSELDAFRKFCEDYNIEWKEPSWSIFSMNG
jgi:hypothetical protein